MLLFIESTQSLLNSNLILSKFLSVRLVFLDSLCLIIFCTKLEYETYFLTSYVIRLWCFFFYFIRHTFCFIKTLDTYVLLYFCNLTKLLTSVREYDDNKGCIVRFVGSYFSYKLVKQNIKQLVTQK